MANERITGFMSHWNTFSGHMMFVVLFVVAFILFAERVRGPAVWIAAIATTVALLRWPKMHPVPLLLGAAVLFGILGAF